MGLSVALQVPGWLCLRTVCAADRYL
jgi:hypothetical protein